MKFRRASSPAHISSASLLDKAVSTRFDCAAETVGRRRRLATTLPHLTISHRWRLASRDAMSFLEADIDTYAQQEGRSD